MTYQVILNLFLTCAGSPVAFPTATPTTNALGYGQADVKFTPEDAADLRRLDVSVNWTVVGPATYVSPCTVVVLD